MSSERRLLLTVALLLALLAGVTGGTIWHHHGQDPTADCPICHSGQAAVVEPASTHWLSGLEPLGTCALPDEPSLVPEPTTRRAPSRAPPSA